MLKFSILAFCVPLFVISCGSPSRDGKKLAEKENKICEQTAEKLDKLEQDFTTAFNADEWLSRQAAKDKWLQRRQEIANQMEIDLGNVQIEVLQVQSQLESKKLYVFQKEYNEKLDMSKRLEVAEALAETDIPQNVLNSIARVNPQKPTESQILTDLAQRSLNDVEGGYFFVKDRLIALSEYDISELNVSSVEKETTSEYIVKVSFSLSGKVNSDRRLTATCKIRYTLPKYDDWSIDFIQTEELNIVSCDIYNSCIKTFERGFMSKDLYVKNECDKSLEVFIRFYEYGKWHKTIVIAKPQDDTFVDYCIPDEYKVEYILPL